MAVSMADITKLRKMTGAGMMDCKNALTEAEGDFDKAMEIIRKSPPCRKCLFGYFYIIFAVFTFDDAGKVALLA